MLIRQKPTATLEQRKQGWNRTHSNAESLRTRHHLQLAKTNKQANKQTNKKAKYSLQG